MTEQTNLHEWNSEFLHLKYIVVLESAPGYVIVWKIQDDKNIMFEMDFCLLLVEICSLPKSYQNTI